MAMRRCLLLAVVLCLAASTAVVPAGADDYPCALVQTALTGSRPDFARFVSVLPPGQNGTAQLEIPSTNVDFGPHFEDQLAMYGDLVYETPMSGGPGIGEAQVPTFFKEAGLNPAGCESVKVVGPGTIVMRTNFGVPHVYGQAAEQVAFGAGYVTAEDRMFQSDLFRNAARGTLSQLLGPDFLEMDKVARRDGYTEAELQQQIANLSLKFGPEYGSRIARGLEAFAAGFNARIVEVLLDPRCDADSGGTVCPGLPVEYIGTGNLPLPWRATDTVAEAVLLARQFGEAAGAEVRNAGLYKGLTDLFGAVEGPKAFDDIRWLNDPGANTTVPAVDGAFTYPNTGAVDPAAVALPDHSAAIAYGDTDVILQLSKVFEDVTNTPWPASNAMLVAPSESTTGNSLQLGDPQVQYAVPQYLMEIGLHGGGFDAEGMTFPGVSGFVLIGHGPDYAWTVTSGISDAVDVRVEKLCDPTGAPPAADSAFYLFDGDCVAMEQRVETILVKNSAPPNIDEESPEVDVVLQRVQRTVHGPVFARDTVDGVPVALTKERAFWGKELDNAAAFGKFNFPEFITSAAAFGDAASAIVVSLNLYYADVDDIGYWHTGRYPVRTQGVETRLPTWGTGEWEWHGNIPYADQPHFIADADSPSARNYTSNWNNKPSTGWANGDDTNWGEIHRVDALMTQMDERLADEGTMSFLDVINVMNNAATVDSRVAKLGPIVTSSLNSSGGGNSCSCLGEIVSTLNDWFDAGPVGGHRIDLNNDGFYDAAPAIRLWDAINEALVEEIFFDEIAPLRGQLGVGTVDYPGPGGSAFFDGMFNHVLHVLDPSPSLTPEHDWLNGETASHVVGRAVDRALAALGVDSAADIDALTMPREEIVFSSQGAHAPYRIHWVNRGTWTHIAEITGRRPPCADCLPLP
jgi:acyl-homoserine lactone acylase PvdQ